MQPTGRPFQFPGLAVQWNSLTDMTDARLLARHLEWAAIPEAKRNQAFNVVNGDVFPDKVFGSNPIHHHVNHEFFRSS